MLLLDAASKLQLTASVAGSLDYVVGKVRNASPNIGIPTKGNVAGTTATDICAVPGGSDVDTVSCITINNVHASTITDVEVTTVGGSTQRVFKVLGLAPGEWILWTDTGVFLVFTATGRVKSDGSTPFDTRGADIASAATLVIPSGMYFHVTGTTGITDIDFAEVWDGRTAKLVFDGKLTLTHNGTTLILPGGQNIVTQAGDACTVVQEGTGDNVRVVQFERNSLQTQNPANASIANQSPAASATTLLTDGTANIPNSGVQIRSRFLWHLVMSKTAAGTVAPVLLIKIGTAGTTADGTVLTFTFPAVGTAAADVLDAWIEMEIVGPLTSACVVRGIAVITRTLDNGVTGWYSVAGLLRIIGTPATFDATVASLKASLSLTLGASYVVTVEQVSVETNNL